MISFTRQLLRAFSEASCSNCFSELTICRRYVDSDMNRCFLLHELADPSLCNREQLRAKQLDEILGPKASDNPASDFIIDLHNTTSACGVALMMAADDHFSHEVLSTHY